LAFNFDGGAPDKLTVGATGAYRISIDVFGLASHAGGAPEAGVSAVTIAALGIADLHAGGWLGDVQKNGHHGTSNVGHVTGGGATNVVTDHVQLKAEARSHNAAFRRRMLKEIESAFRRAAAAVQNVEGRPGKAKIESRLDYDAFRLADDEPCVLAAESAVRSIGLEPLRAIANGGVDANWLTARGIPTVTLGCGQMNVHTANERLDVDRFLQSCRIGLRLATASEE
jgi:tripeptide aminopeptidase